MAKKYDWRSINEATEGLYKGKVLIAAIRRSPDGRYSWEHYGNGPNAAATRKEEAPSMLQAQADCLAHLQESRH